MIYKIDKVTYIVAIFFIVAVLDIAFNKSGINFRFIFYFLFSLIIFKDIINANLQWFFSKTNFKIFKKVLFLYFLCHPILISIFGLFGFWGLLYEHTYYRYRQCEIFYNYQRMPALGFAAEALL